MKTKYQYLMDDICMQLAEDYFHANYYYSNDIVEGHAVEDDLEIELDFYEAIEKINIEQYEDRIANIRMITERLKSLDQDASDMLISKLATTYLSYHDGMYMNWDQEQKEVEFVFNITIKETDLDDVEYFLGLQKQEDEEQ